MFFLLQCGKLETRLLDCQTAEGRFIDGHHYVSSEFITEDGTWDYQKLHEYREKKARFYPNPECIDAPVPVTLEETLEKEAENIDFSREKSKVEAIGD